VKARERGKAQALAEKLPKIDSVHTNSYFDGVQGIRQPFFSFFPAIRASAR